MKEDIQLFREGERGRNVRRNDAGWKPFAFPSPPADLLSGAYLNVPQSLACSSLCRCHCQELDMALVNYSDSEESDTEQATAAPPSKPLAKAPAASNPNFSIDRANPQKIRVKLTDTLPTNKQHEDEPAPKRARIGGGGFSGFNSLLPPPKRDADKPQSSTNKGPARKVFSLKTGAEPGFSRESDAELKNFFAEQDTDRQSATEAGDDVGIPDIRQKKPLPPVPTTTTTMGNTFMFKPLSVARNPNKKKKTTNGAAKAAMPADAAQTSTTISKSESIPAAPPKKVNLFSIGNDEEKETFLPDPLPDEDYDDPTPTIDDDYYQPQEPTPSQPTQSLHTIATDLDLTTSQRRQLFGRSKNPSSQTTTSITNFNTDAEYLANEEMRATGEQVQHNPLRAIAPGKHSLKQLVSAAVGQKDALEESFASGRRNKKEAGNRYGW